MLSPLLLAVANFLGLSRLMQLWYDVLHADNIGLTMLQNNFGIGITTKLLTVPGRVLDVPRIKYHGNDAPPRFGSWNMQNAKFVTQSTLPIWTYLRISLVNARSPWQDDGAFKKKMDELQQQLSELGIHDTKKNYRDGVHTTARPEDLEGEIDKWVNRFATSGSAKRPTLILIIIPDSATFLYNRIKYICDVKEGILNVCVLASKFAKANPQYLANVGLKFNLKLGGRNHSLDRSKLGFISEGKTMVVGIDVTHPSPGSSSNAPSIAGIVASVDEWLGQWPADLCIQPPRQEIVADLDVLFKSRLELWRKRNGKLPENILVYRDGVSEGQYNIVLDDELQALRKACGTVYSALQTKNQIPRITMIIVGKRHNTRFYPTKKDDADRGSNPVNGTVVDRGITEARNWDFFLQAHAAIQGTARPAHYYVVHDEIFSGLKLPPQFPTAADALEDLTHNMCYLFGRATKAVSICPPAYYADLVCMRARCYLSGLFDPSPLSSPDASSVGTAAAAVAHTQQSNLVKIHQIVKDAMFYI